MEDINLNIRRIVFHYKGGITIKELENFTVEKYMYEFKYLSIILKEHEGEIAT